jgi:uncharacterized protein (TIGR02271 family)
VVQETTPTPPAAGASVEQQQVSTGQFEGQTNVVVPLYQESLVVGKREVDAGSVRLKKIVKTETVNKGIELRHEELVIDRDGNVPQGAQSLGRAFEEQEMVINLKREEPVIEKQTTSAGQIVLQTRYALEQTNIQAQIRREDVDIDKQGNPQNVIIGQNVQRSSSSVGAAESAGGRSAGAATGGPITDPAMLTSATDASTLAGRPVQLSGLKVQKVIGDRLLVVGPDSSQQLYVMPTRETPMPRVGDTVNLTGTIKPASAAAQTGLNSESVQALGSQPFYIDAEKIETR